MKTRNQKSVRCKCPRCGLLHATDITWLNPLIMPRLYCKECRKAVSRLQSWDCDVNPGDQEAARIPGSERKNPRIWEDR